MGQEYPFDELIYSLVPNVVIIPLIRVTIYALWSLPRVSGLLDATGV